MAKKNQNADEKPEVVAPIAEQQPDAIEVACPVPTFTLRADDEFGMRAMMFLSRHFGAAPRQLYAAVREFDLYEERIRTAKK